MHQRQHDCWLWFGGLSPQYGSFGMMTFVVNHHGKIYQKDVGQETAEIAATMKEYNPDPTREPV